MWGLVSSDSQVILGNFRTVAQSPDKEGVRPELLGADPGEEIRSEHTLVAQVDRL